jgi:hypothetical protein
MFEAECERKEKLIDCLSELPSIRPAFGIRLQFPRFGLAKSTPRVQQKQAYRL